jgi:ribosome modulation factor
MGNSCPARYRAYCRGYRRGLVHRYYGKNSRLVGHVVDVDEQVLMRGYQDGLEGREYEDYEVVCGQPT